MRILLEVVARLSSTASDHCFFQTVEIPPASRLTGRVLLCSVCRLKMEEQAANTVHSFPTRMATRAENASLLSLMNQGTKEATSTCSFLEALQCPSARRG